LTTESELSRAEKKEAAGEERRVSFWVERLPGSEDYLV
jgi:hypothetical protein